MKRINVKGLIPAVIGVILMLIGYNRGESALVLSKAIRVCLECIGIG